VTQQKKQNNISRHGAAADTAEQLQTTCATELGGMRGRVHCCLAVWMVVRSMMTITTHLLVICSMTIVEV